MTNLTEQWKKGELPDGWYYVRYKWYRYGIPTYCRDRKLENEWNVAEVIAQVPSYEGLMTLARAYDDVTDENAKLKELLKECRENIECTGYNEFGKAILLHKISEVLGEE